MTHTFYLKQPKGKSKTIILFSCYFKAEHKKFVYSTGEKILPEHWSFKENRPKLKGSCKDPSALTIKTQLNRYSDAFLRAETELKRMSEEFTSKYLRKIFDQTFKKSGTQKDLFFDAYDEFIKEKVLLREWKEGTRKRYVNIKNHLIAFQIARKHKLTFNNINDKFYAAFTDYCYSTLDHNTNTFVRNVGLFKTFMYWALDKKFTYNKAFIKFKSPGRVVTKEIALTLEQVQTIFEFDSVNKSLERVKDIFVFQCLTGLRYGELKRVHERNVISGVLMLKEEKEVSKEVREIPLFSIAQYILKKYDYRLPLLSNQKQNGFIKDVVKAVGYTNMVEFTRTKNKHQEILQEPFYDRISTHTARRTFITIMKKKGIADKTIMSMTGHKDFKTFNTYYKVDNIARKDAMELAFGEMTLPKLKTV